MRTLFNSLVVVVVASAAATAQAPDTLQRPIMQAGKPKAAPATNHAADSVALRLFGDTLVAVPDSAASDEPTWDIDVRSYETRDRVAHFVNLFSGRAKEHIAQRLEHGTRYEPMIRARMRAGGLPEDMYYLALVESGFDPNAYSRAAAVGMWQFMTSTARDMGLRVDRWVDERRDPVRSTTAAVRFIRDLRDQFGSLYLAAAAYNGGPGRVARGMKRYADDVNSAESEDPFFVLAEKEYLRNETRDYVPQLIAAALIAKEPARYGMELHSLPPFAYDSVLVPESTPLSAVAKAAGTDMRTLLELNPQFLKGMTPPREASPVRIPLLTAAGFDSAFAALPATDRKATHLVETKKGDTPERIARANDISVAALRAFNPDVKALKSGRYPVGRTLVVPSADVASAARNVPDPAIEKYSRKSAGKSRTHTVDRGESLSTIARHYGTTSERLMKLNGLKKAVIYPGQSLIVTSAKSAKTKGAKSKGTTKKAPPVKKAPSTKKKS
jgi:membrane-bound lytic murein transglycosylase D